VVAKRNRAVDVVFEGMVKVKVPAVIVCEPNVWTLTALSLCVELYINTVSNAVVSVTVVYVMLADGVQYATPAVAELLLAKGAVALVTVTPPAVYPVPDTSFVTE
jgi:hypothetical protein